MTVVTLCRFSGDFDIHYFVSAKKLTKWAAAFGERGRAHVVVQCDSVQILQPNSQELCRWSLFLLKGISLNDIQQNKMQTRHGCVCNTCTFKRLGYSRRIKDLFHSWQRSRFLQRSLGRWCHKFADPQLQVIWNLFSWQYKTLFDIFCACDVLSLSLSMIWRFVSNKHLAFQEFFGLLRLGHVPQ